jgi:two-component system, OmpR family, phosphate regulon response regulator OmpR
MGGRGGILVVDPDETTRAAVRVLADRLRYDSIVFDDATELLDGLEERPALGIIEVELQSSTSGLEVLCDLHNTYGDDLPVVLVSAARTAPHERAVGLLLGADDYITKPFDVGEFHARVRRSLRRAEAWSSRLDPPGSEFTLSAREQEVLSLLAVGSSQQEIATTLFISSKTVATHIQHLLTKLSVHSRAQAVSLAFRRGLVSADTSGEAVAR